MVFLFLCGYVNKATAYIEDAELTKANTVYTELLFELYWKRSKVKRKFKVWMSRLQREVGELNYTMDRLIEDKRQCGLFVMKFNLLDDPCEDLYESRSITSFRCCSL